MASNVRFLDQVPVSAYGNTTALTINTGSFMITGSASGSTLTFTKGDGTTFELFVSGSGSSGGTSVIANPGGSGDALTTISIDGTVYIISGSSGGSGSGFPFSGSAVITGSLLVSGSTVDFSSAPLTASIISSSNGITGSLFGTATTALIANTASFIPFNGNRAISNQDQPEGIKNVNFSASGLTDFINKVYFTNTPPEILTSNFTIGEFEPSASLVGVITASDAESGSQTISYQTASSYIADQFRISSSGNFGYYI